MGRDGRPEAGDPEAGECGESIVASERYMAETTGPQPGIAEKKPIVFGIAKFSWHTPKLYCW